MSTRRWHLLLIAGLSTLTVLLYAIRWALFPGWAFHNEMWRFLVGDVAFLFLQVILVTMLIEAVIERRAREEKRRKLNMVIGAFFSQLGTDVLGRIAQTDSRLSEVRDGLVPTSTWTSSEFKTARAVLTAHEPSIVLPAPADLEALKERLAEEKHFVLDLLANQSLLEHESFSELLWALTHLAEELAARPNLIELPQPDRAHLAVDMKRAFQLLLAEWIGYMEHLAGQYPYLFSLAARTNPLDPEACVTVAK